MTVGAVLDFKNKGGHPDGLINDKSATSNVANYEKWNRGAKHKWITKDIASKLPRIGTTSEMEAKDVKVHLKLFNPTGAGSWFITEANLDTGEAFGYADLGDPDNAELGYMDLNELRSFKGRFGLGIERDESFSATLEEVMSRKRT